MSFLNDGALLVKNFLDESTVENINREFNDKFQNQSINGSPGYIKISNKVLRLRNVFSDIESIDLIKMVVRISAIAQENGVNISDYRLSEIDAYSEQGDKEKLGWHTDHSDGGFLAIVYVSGGDHLSGGSLYGPGTHKQLHSKELHYLGPELLNSIRSNTLDLSGAPGDLVLYFLNGFHSRHPTLLERRAFRLLFYKKTEPPENFDDFILPISILKKNELPDILSPKCESYPREMANAGRLYLERCPPQIGFDTVYRVFTSFISSKIKKFKRQIKK